MAKVLVDTVSGATEAIEELSRHAVVAVDVEGENLGHRGRVALIQVAVEPPKKCYVFDVLAVGVPAGLKQLLESSSVVKVRRVILLEDLAWAGLVLSFLC
mmetsp:Transcript_63505/g.118090  ORF Transcript_63505/g.118090 Transcript_63505/m.118090 type:complete len:100 (+) Transcript_63505:64-363(+)